MSSALPPVDPDPEFDPPPGATRRTGWLNRPPGFEFPERFQRLVANPFLMIVGLAAWWGVWRAFFPTPYQWPNNAMAATVVLTLTLPQYHCLDCGATGQLGRWRNHACEAVRMRRAMGHERRFRGPTPGVQTVLLLFALMVGTAVTVAFLGL